MKFLVLLACMIAPMAITEASAQSFPPLTPGSSPTIPPFDAEQSNRLREAFEEQQREAEEQEARERESVERLAERERTRRYSYEAYCLIDHTRVRRSGTTISCSDYVTTCFLSGPSQGEIYLNADPYYAESLHFSIPHDDNHSFATNAAAFATRAMDKEIWVQLKMRTESGPRFPKLTEIGIANMWGVNYCREQLGSGNAAARRR